MVFVAAAGVALVPQIDTQRWMAGASSDAGATAWKEIKALRSDPQGGVKPLFGLGESGQSERASESRAGTMVMRRRTATRTPRRER